MESPILLVDDEEGIRTVLGIALADIGYAVQTAEDGRQALDLFHQHQPAIVITDIKMPGMDGIDLLRQIKAESPDTEVIMLTGHGDMDLAIKCLKLEATDFITKPINDDAMEIALKRAHDRIDMRRQLRQYTENLERLVAEKSARLVAAERRAAVGQAVEALASAWRGIAGDLDSGIPFFNDLPCFVAIHSRDLRIVAINDLFRDKLGDQTGQPSWAVYRGVDATANDCPAAGTLAAGRGLQVKKTVALADGSRSEVFVHTAPIRDAEGRIELIIEIAADIQEIGRLREALRTSQQQYQQLFQEAPCYITVQDAALHITAANRRFQQDFDMTAGMRCHEIYKNRDSACPDCPVAKTFADGRSHQCEMSVTARHGERYQVLIHTAPLRDAAGKITHVMEMSTNITQVRRLQDKLSHLGLLIGSVSHGMKGLLTGLDGGLYLMDSGVTRKDGDKVAEGLDIVRQMSGRIRQLVLDILFYARQKDLKLETVALPEFGKDMVQAAAARIGERPIELEHRIDPALAAMPLDVGVLRATLLNIIENAIEACMADSADKSHRIQFDMSQDDQDVVITVRDNGIGMDATTRDKIFTPFFSSKGDQGTGLGLFIASQILRQQGGQIDLTSAPGKGTTFSVRIPRTFPLNGLDAAPAADPVGEPRS